MLLNFIKVDLREEKIIEKYFELIKSGVKTSEILVLVQNSTIKRLPNVKMNKRIWKET